MVPLLVSLGDIIKKIFEILRCQTAGQFFNLPHLLSLYILNVLETRKNALLPDGLTQPLNTSFCFVF